MAALAECCVQGVGTRKVVAICEELFGDRLSDETVSRYAQELGRRARPVAGAAARGSVNVTGGLIRTRRNGATASTAN